MIAVAVIGLGIGFRSDIHKQLNNWKLLPQPEKLTELYFTNPNSLPTKYSPEQTQTVSFTAHNLEYQTVDYNYKIVESSQTNNQSQTLVSGNFTLSQNGYEKKSVNITTADLGSNVKVEVDLINVNESIDYLLGRIGA